jgi:RNA recognition motif-containing protein
VRGAVPSKKIYVGNLPHSVTEIAISAKFREYGPVIGVRLIEDRATGRALGYGFIEMGTAADARRAIEALDGSDFEGWQLTVKTALPQGSDDRGARR